VEIMRKSLIASGLALGTGFYLWSIASVSAADFYILNVTGENEVSLLDPATIIAGQPGHKLFHLAEISEFDLWLDNKVEIDCPGARMRKLSAVSHLAGGTTMPGLSTPGPWDQLRKGSVGLYIHDVICQWPNSKPTGSAVYPAADFGTAVSHISARIGELNRKRNK
jgi:hypothetical protein